MADDGCVSAFSPRHYVCQMGHEFRAYAPFSISFGPLEDKVRTEQLCPVCLVKFLNDTCGGVTERTMG